MSYFENDLEYRTGLLESLMEKLMSRSDPEDRETQAISIACNKLFALVAKYQAPDEDFIDRLTVREIEQDMVVLTTLAMNTGIASSKALAASKHFVALGKKKGADQILKERSAKESEGEKFVASAAKPLDEQQKAAYNVKAAKVEAEGEALKHVTEIADKLTQVLKKIHDRMLREMASGT